MYVLECQMSAVIDIACTYIPIQLYSIVITALYKYDYFMHTSLNAFL